MSTAERVKILDYLPPEQKQKVLMLVQRLKEQSDAKEKYAALYQSAQTALDTLTQKYNKLKDENDYLKQQIHNSFSIVSQVRANFRANKQKLASQHGAEEEEWEDAEEEGEENRQEQANHNHSGYNKPPKPSHKSPLQKYRPPMTSGKKTGSLLNISGTDLNHTSLSGSKGKEIEDLRREVRALQEDKKRKEGKEKDIKEKHRLVDQIKNRYKGGEDIPAEQPSNCKESTIQKIDITDTFDNEDQQPYLQRPKDKISRVKSTEKASIAKQKSYKQTFQPKITQQHKNKSQANPKAPPSQLVTSNDYNDVLQMINSYNL